MDGDRLDDEDRLLAFSFLLHVWGVARHGDVLGTDRLHEHEGGFESLERFEGSSIKMTRIRHVEIHNLTEVRVGKGPVYLLVIFVVEDLGDRLVLDLSHVQIDDGVLYKELGI